MIEFEERPEAEPSQIAKQNVPETDAGAGSVGARDGGADAAAEERADGGARNDAQALPAPPLALAFIEDADNDVARLRIVDVPGAIEGSSSGGDAPWRATRSPVAQSGDALDFAWSPDGQRLVLRYESLAGPRLAFFAAPSWNELPIDDLDAPASQPVLSATARYAWSPDSVTLAAEFTSAEGTFVAGHVLGDAGIARAMLPVAFSTGLESMAWFSSGLLMVIQPSPDAREVITLELTDGELETQRVLPSGTFLSPLELRRAPGGVIAATRSPSSWFHFWPADTAPEAELSYTGYAFISGGQRFVAETDEDEATASVERLGGPSGVLDTLPECPVVLTWGEGTTPGALEGSKVACLRVLDGVAAIRVYSYPSGGPRNAQPLDSEALRADYAAAGGWEGHARVFSPGNDWLVLSNAARDVLVDLRTADPGLLELPGGPEGNTAQAFAPSGRFLLSQRGAQLRLVALPGAPAGFPLLLPLPLPDAAVLAPPCSIAPHTADWCGAPGGAREASARWSTQGDIAALLLLDEGLSTLAIGEREPTPRRTSVSSCGSACVRQYAFNL
jgi:hypothetical protein